LKAETKIRRKQEFKQSRLQSIYDLRVLHKKTFNHIGFVFGISHHTAKRAFDVYSKQVFLSAQTASELIYFYENEIAQLLEKRKKATPRTYATLTKLVIEIQEKIAELCKLLDRQPQFNIENHTHYTNYVVVRNPKALQEENASTSRETEGTELPAR